MKSESFNLIDLRLRIWATKIKMLHPDFYNVYGLINAMLILLFASCISHTFQGAISENILITTKG